MKTDIIKNFNLPSYIKGKTMSEASQAIDKKFKDRTDSVSMRTKEALLERLSKAQEYIKMQQSLAANAQQVPDQMQGQVPEGMEQFAQGQQEQFGGMSPDENSALGYAASMMKGQQDSAQDSPQQMAYGGYQNKMAFGGGWGSSAGGSAASSSGGGNMMGSIMGMMGNMGGGKGKQQAPLVGSSEKDYIMYGDKSGSEIKTQEGVKDAAGQLGPWFKAFRMLQKAGTSGGEKIASKAKGSGGRTFGHGMASFFSPSKTAVSISKNKDAKMGERLAAWFLPGTGLTGSIAAKYAQERKNKLELKKIRLTNNQYKQSDFAMGGYMGNDPNNQMMRTNDFSDYTNMMNNMGKSFAMGGNMTNKYDTGGGLFNSYKENRFNKSNEYFAGEATRKKAFDESNAYFAGEATNKAELDAKNERVAQRKENITKVGAFTKKNLPKAMRYAPVLGNLLELHNLKKAKDPRRNRLSNRYKEILADEKEMQNIVNNQNVNRAIQENSGGNLGAAMANTVAANTGKLGALGNAYINAKNIKRQENVAGQQFNLNVDKTNLGQSNLDETDAQMNEGAYQTAKMQLKQAIYGDVGNIGKEGVQKAQVAKMFGYTYDGEYYYKDGKKHTEDEYKRAIAEDTQIG